MNIFGLFSGAENPAGMMEYLDDSSYDELAEIDLRHDRCRNLYHMEGKYFVPLMDCSFSEMRRFAQENMIHPDDRTVYAEFMDAESMERRLAESPAPGFLSAQMRYRLLDGSWRWTESVLAGGERNGFAPGMVKTYIFDIQNQKDRREGRVSVFPGRREYDELTGLPREKDFFAEGRNVVREHPDGWCLIAIDIENFKLFNDWYGREAGDALLARVGTLLQNAARDSGGLAGYLGQDDFCLIAPFDQARIDHLYRELQALVTKSDDTSSVGFLPALGIALVEDGAQILDLFDRAAFAARKIKGDFHTRILVYQPSMLEQTEEEYRILSDFQSALKRGEVYFCLQPQCRV
ncbi:MAG: diguanylate cyclase, partial [Oscillibacter sp.]|nr:diguanylate cyclase [Oscillibacter sp.]